MEEYMGWVIGNTWGFGPTRTFEIQAFKYRNIFILRWKDSKFLQESYDDNLIQYLKIDADIYYTTLKKYGGIKHRQYDYMYFKNKYHARQAADWINSIIMANKIAGEN